MATYDNVKWGLLFQYPIKRLNIVTDAPVQLGFLDNLVFLGYSGYDIMDDLFEEDELKTIIWYWKSQKVAFPEEVYLFKVPIEQHLRFGRRKSIHFEDWIFAVFKCSDNMFRLCPLKRDSDFTKNIFETIHKKTRRDIQRFPWKRLSFFEIFGFKQNEVQIIDPEQLGFGASLVEPPKSSL
jgi:hypothetical protein